MWIMLRTPKPSTTTHSQVTLRKKVQPSRRSCNVEVASARGARGGIFTGSSRSAASGPGEGVDGQRPAGAGR